jgi:hypothetical protein
VTRSGCPGWAVSSESPRPAGPRLVIERTAGTREGGSSRESLIPRTGPVSPHMIVNFLAEKVLGCTGPPVGD